MWALLALPFVIAFGLTGAYRYRAAGGGNAALWIILAISIFLLIQAIHGTMNVLDNFEGIVEHINSSNK